MYKIANLNGNICVVSVNEMYEEPKKILNYYPTDIKTYQFLRNFDIEDCDRVEITNHLSYGIFEFCIKTENISRIYYKLQLREGEKTLSISTEVQDIPQPKVKSGIPVEWRNGQWKKNLKNKGWVPAY
jgi:hypothetical protein